MKDQEVGSSASSQCSVVNSSLFSDDGKALKTLALQYFWCDQRGAKNR